MWADQALDKLLADYAFVDVLDIGSGDGEHAARLRAAGKRVATISLRQPAEMVADFMGCALRGVDCIWASHVLEHQRNPGAFLDKCFDTLLDGGVLAITVPPRKDAIVGGHVSLWNPGLLLYHLVLAGFDCSQASVKVYGYNISVIVRKHRANLPGLNMDAGDIHALRAFFPFPVDEGFDGNMDAINW